MKFLRNMLILMSFAVSSGVLAGEMNNQPAQKVKIQETKRTLVLDKQQLREGDGFYNFSTTRGDYYVLSEEIMSELQASSPRMFKDLIVNASLLVGALVIFYVSHKVNQNRRSEAERLYGNPRSRRA